MICFHIFPKACCLELLPLELLQALTFGDFWPILKAEKPSSFLLFYYLFCLASFQVCLQASLCSWCSDFWVDFCEWKNLWQCAFNYNSCCSVAGSSATIFAYLGEFHSSQNRSKILMAASFVYGVGGCSLIYKTQNNNLQIVFPACNYMPILGFFILNQSFHFHVPLFNVEYKPWRFYLLCCGLPSLICAIILMFIPESPKYTFTKVD